MRLFIMTFCVLTLMGCVTSNDPTPKQHLMQMEAYNSLSIQQLKQMAEQGDSDAALALGAAYSKGERGVAVNRVEAAKWIIQSAEAGNAIAQHSAGTAYIVGLGVEKDIARAWS